MGWTLSGQGSVGTGDIIILSGLADGEYTLTLTATDISAQAGVESITFRVGEVRHVYLPVILRQ